VRVLLPSPVQEAIIAQLDGERRERSHGWGAFVLHKLDGGGSLMLMVTMER
jgi:hypothetical protein